MRSKIERRYAGAAGAVGVIARDAGSGIGNAIRGLALVWYNPADRGTEYTLFRNADGSPSLVERILPGACDDVLRQKQDVVALWNHDPGVLLGRVCNSTLKLTATSKGLAYEINADQDPDSFARPVLCAIRRGDCQGSSFSFLIGTQRYVTSKTGPDVREILSFTTIADISPVSQPAYQSTTAFASQDDDDDEEADEFPFGRSARRDPVFREWQEARVAAGAARPTSRRGHAAGRGAELARMKEQLRQAEASVARLRLERVEGEIRGERPQQTFPCEPELARIAKDALSRHYE